MGMAEEVHRIPINPMWLSADIFEVLKDWLLPQ
jgi:hypothetical protein